MGYVYIEYPKCLYQGDQTLVVQDREEEDNAAAMGWLTAEQFHNKSVAEPVEEPPVVSEPVEETLVEPVEDEG